jgi:hypothetical protein
MVLSVRQFIGHGGQGSAHPGKWRAGAAEPFDAESGIPGTEEVLSVGLPRFHILRRICYLELLTPFLFMREGFRVEYLGKQTTANGELSCFRITFPDDLPTHCRTQTFYFDEKNCSVG